VALPSLTRFLPKFSSKIKQPGFTLFKFGIYFIVAPKITGYPEKAER